MDLSLFHLHNDHGELTALVAMFAFVPVLRTWARVAWARLTCPSDCPAKDVEHEHEVRASCSYEREQE